LRAEPLATHFHNLLSLDGRARVGVRVKKRYEDHFPSPPSSPTGGEEDQGKGLSQRIASGFRIRKKRKSQIATGFALAMTIFAFILIPITHSFLFLHITHET